MHPACDIVMSVVLSILPTFRANLYHLYVICGDQLIKQSDRIPCMHCAITVDQHLFDN